VDAQGKRHTANADTFVTLSDDRPMRYPSMTLSALRADCAAVTPASDLPCPIANPRATYTAIVIDIRKSRHPETIHWGWIVGGSLAAGAAVGEVGCLASWCDSKGRTAVVATDVGVVLVIGAVALGWAILTSGVHGD